MQREGEGGRGRERKKKKMNLKFFEHVSWIKRKNKCSDKH